MALVDKVMAYECDLMGREETIEFFQDLVDAGFAWRLQGHYGRTAQALIEQGLVTAHFYQNDPNHTRLP